MTSRRLWCTATILAHAVAVVLASFAGEAGSPTEVLGIIEQHHTNSTCGMPVMNSDVPSPPTTQNDASTDRIPEYATEMIDWFRSKGGSWSDKLEIRRRIPGDPTSPSGIFARADIGRKERLVRMPRQLFLTVSDELANAFRYGYEEDYKDSEEEDYDEETTYYREAGFYSNGFVNCTCHLSKRLLEETLKYRESPALTDFAPYIRYLEDTQPKGQVPATYSQEGKTLLRYIQGMADVDVSVAFGKSQLPPANLVDFIEHQFVRTGCIDGMDDDAIHAVATTLQRGFDVELLPVWDMVNHDVVERTNVKMSSLRRDKDEYRVWATRRIQAGEELLFSYNGCTDCYDVRSIWGTPGMYRDFGFLEEYPQLWPFLDHYVLAEIHRHDDNSFYATFHSQGDVTNDYYFAYVDDDEDENRVFAPDSAEKLHFFEMQLERLEEIDLDMELSILSSVYERTMIQQYYDSMNVALHAIMVAGRHYLFEQQ